MYILVVHAWPIGGFGRDPIDALTDGRLGGGGVVAVAAFFGLSGYLLVSSRRRQKASTFALRRAARIFPAYTVVVVATSLFVGQQYLAAAWFPVPGVGGISSVLLEARPSVLVNASLWTLWPELCCYLLLVAIPPRHLSRTLPAIGLVAMLMAVIVPGPSLALTIVFGPTSAFLVGAAIAVWRDRVPMSWALGLGCLSVAYTSAGSLGGTILVHAAFAYVAVLVGLRLPLRWNADLSYGTYLFAFPITQGLSAMGWSGFGPVPLALASVAITLPLAAASWQVVESPMLGFTRRGLAGSKVARRAPDAVARM